MYCLQLDNRHRIMAFMCMVLEPSEPYLGPPQKEPTDTQPVELRKYIGSHYERDAFYRKVYILFILCVY